jgi:hypothetical protein
MKFLRKLLTALIILATLGVGMLFALQNKTPVPLDLLTQCFRHRGIPRNAGLLRYPGAPESLPGFCQPPAGEKPR